MEKCTLLFIVSMVTHITADYDCVCNYAVENPVYPASNINGQPIGYMYEFDCKPEFSDKGDFFGIQFEKQEGYILKSQQVQRQICPGVFPDTDRIPTTTTVKYVATTTTLKMTTTEPTTTKTTTATTTATKTTSTPITTTTTRVTTPTTRVTTPTSTPTTTTTTRATTPTSTPTTTTTTRVTTPTTTPTTTTTTRVTTPTTTPTTTTTTRATTPTSTPTTTTTTRVTTPTTTPTTTSTTRATTPTTTPTTTERPTTTPEPVTWPVGTYGLMQTRQGCPGGNTRWIKGWRKQDTEDSDSHNYFTPNIQHFLDGEFAANNLATSFCIKDIAATSRYDKPWPRGAYCLLKHKACPAGFRSGFIFWDDEDSGNGNSHGGALPDGVYDGNTKIYYCCRGDGQTNSEIILPRERPFILLRFGTICQSVRGMSVQDVFVRWDDEDTLNSSGRGGVYPFDDGGNKDHTLHFCYYQSIGGPSFVG